MNKIKNILENNKKKLVVIVLLLLAITLSTGYILTNKKSDVKPTSNKTSEVTSKEDKSDKKNTVKSDTKKEDKKDNKQEVKEDKKSDTKVEETKTTETNTSDNTSNVTETTNNNVSNNTSSNTSYTQPTSTPCVPTYTTVNHPEQGHYETQVVTPAWDEAVYAERIVGLGTGRIYNSLEEWGNHIDEDGNYAVKRVQVDTIHHEAETQQVWVVDQQAWTETVASGC